MQTATIKSQTCFEVQILATQSCDPSSWLWPLQVAATACSTQSTHALATPTRSNQLSSRNRVHQHPGEKTSTMGLRLGHSEVGVSASDLGGLGISVCLTVAKIEMSV